jgi:hypothetical protein
VSAIDLKLLPGTAHNEWGYNGVPFIQDNVLTSGGYQYAVWWDTNRLPIIGQRSYPGGGEWTTFDLSAVSGNPLDAPVRLDAHNSIAVGIDVNGRLHVVGNHHGSPMRYCRSTNSHDITAWESTNKPGGAFTEITYPQLFRLSGGDLFVVYREGGSGNGDDYTEKWDPVAGTWGEQTKVLDGVSSGENPYLHHVAVSDDDAVHLAVVWRGTSGANSNNDLCHIVSRDGCVTWEEMDGTALTLPIDHATCPLVVDTAATGSGIINQSGMDVDPEGNPHLVAHIFDDTGSVSRILYSRWDGGAWVSEKLFDWTYQMPVDVSLINAEIARPAIVCSPAGRVLVIYRSNQDGLRGAIRIYDVTNPTGRRSASILNLELYAWEPTFDTAAARATGLLHMLVTPCRTADPTVPEYDDEDWTVQPLAILTVDLTQVDAILAGTVTVPDAWADTVPETPAPIPGTSVVAVAVIRTAVTWLGADLVTGQVIATLPDVTGRVGRLLGASTSAQLNLPIPIGGPGALPISLVEQATEPARVLMVAVVNDVPVWGGIPLLRRGGTGGVLELGCVTVEGYLDRRFVGDHTWLQLDQAAIAAGLIEDAQLEGIGLVVDAPTSGVLRDRSYAAQDDSTVYSRLQELMAVEGGPEWTVDLDWVDTSHQRIAKIIRVRNRIGVAATDPRATFTSTAAAEATYSYEEDYTSGRGANHIMATSSGEGDARPQSTPARDETLLAAGMARYERRFTPSTSIVDVAVLDGHAAAELARRRYGARLWQIQARWDAYPRLGVDWALGDDIGWRLTGHRHPSTTTGTGRCIGWELDMPTGRVSPILLDPTGDVT